MNGSTIEFVAGVIVMLLAALAAGLAIDPIF